MSAQPVARLYLALANDLSAMIARGAYREGDRLPSVRMLHEERGIAIGTVSQALAELERRGAIEARPRSGYYVLPVHATARDTRASERATPVPLPHVTDDFVMASADAALLPMGGTVLSPAIVPVAALARIGRRILASQPDVLATYGPPAGDPALRREIAKRMVTIGVGISPDDVVITSGCMNAMRLAIGVATKPGDTVVIESPTFFAVLPMLRDAGLLVIEVDATSEQGIDLDALESVAEAQPVHAVIVSASIQNPTGAVLSDAAKHRLLAITRRCGARIIEDDVYGELYFGTQRPGPLAAIATAVDQVFYCSSFSKTLAPGLRVGYVISRGAHHALARAKLAHTIASPVLNQRIVAEFLGGGAYERHLRRLRHALAQQVASARAAIVQHFPRTARVTAPVGGFVLWVELEPGTDSLALYQRARQAGISILPGAVCALTPRFAHCIRISCGHPWTQAFDAGMRVLAGVA
jgi:DNA-binding transcriptional MocR family regulator